MGLWLALAAPGTLFFYMVRRWYRRRQLRDARRMVTEFRRMFPYGCAACSFHAYGVRQGYKVGEKPDPHDCPKDQTKTYRSPQAPLPEAEEVNWEFVAVQASARAAGVLKPPPVEPAGFGPQSGTQ